MPYRFVVSSSYQGGEMSERRAWTLADDISGEEFTQASDAVFRFCRDLIAEGHDPVDNSMSYTAAETCEPPQLLKVESELSRRVEAINEKAKRKPVMKLELEKGFFK